MADAIQLQTEIDLFGKEITDGPDINKEQLATALYAQLKQISLDDFVSMFTSGFDSVIDYAKLCAGEKTGQRISLLYNPHRLDTGTKRFPISLYAALKDERFVRGLARVVLINMKKGNTRDLLYASVGMGVQGTSYVQEFPPHVARDLALEYGLTKNSHVLDPCAGWGGRMLGFSAVVDRYTCCEPSTRTAAGLRKILPFIKSFRNDFNATIHELPFEDVELQHSMYDFAMTSPPYYDTEQYAPGEAANSFNRYATFEDWCAGFYAPLIHRTMAALKPGACFVINIGSRLYPLNDRLYSVAKDRYHVEKQKGRLSASNGLGKDGEGETFYEVRNPTDKPILVRDASELTPETGRAVDVTLNVSGTPAPDVLVISSWSELALSAPITIPSPDAPAFVGRVADVELLKPSVSALDFALRQSDEPDALPDAVPAQVVEAAAVVRQSASSIVADLQFRGHTLFVREGKLYVSDSSKLSDVDRDAIKLVKADIITFLGHAPPIRVETPSTSLAQFLGTARTEVTWHPQEPPQLDNMTDIVINFETNGLEWHKKDRAIGVTVGTLDGQFKRFLPFGFRGGGNLDETTVKRWAERELRGKHITNAHTKFDVHTARVWGIDLEAQGNTVSDVQHYAALLDDHRKMFRVDMLAKDYLGGIEFERVDESSMENYSASEVAARAEYQVQLVAQLRAKMWPLLDAEDLQRVRQLEDDVIYPVVEMEKNAAPIDMQLLAQYKAQCESLHDNLMMRISQEAGFAFEHTASGWQRLFERFGFPPQESYAEDVVGEIDHPTIALGHFASQLASLNSKVFTPYTKEIGADGLLYFKLNQLAGEDGGTVSGRFSAAYIQQVPNHDNHSAVFGEELYPRRLYVPKSGLYFAADAAQQEYRIFAHHANNPKVMAAYAADPTMSFHRLIYSLMLAHKPDMLYTAQKNMNFMKIFGGGLVKTAAMMGFISHRVADEMKREDAENRKLKKRSNRKNDPRLAKANEVEAIYKREMPETDELLKKASHLAMTKCDEWCNQSDVSRRLHRQFPHRGWVSTISGRRARFHNNYNLHKALNRVVQGTGADIMKAKLAHLHRERKHTGFLMRMTVHDEITGDVPDAESAERVKEILNQQAFPELKVPILWEGQTGKNWAECK